MATRPVSSKRRRRPPPEGGLEVFVADEQAEHPVDVARWSRLAERVLEAQGVHGDAELSVLFVDDEVMAELNKRFMDEDGPTDVLAFPLDDDLVELGRWPDAGTTGPDRGAARAGRRAAAARRRGDLPGGGGPQRARPRRQLRRRDRAARRARRPARARHGPRRPSDDRGHAGARARAADRATTARSNATPGPALRRERRARGHGRDRRRGHDHRHRRAPRAGRRSWRWPRRRSPA